MAGRKLYLVAYDVHEPRRLREALRIVRAYATGGQLSVHECWLSDGEHDVMVHALEDLLDEFEDRFFTLRLDPRAGFEGLGVAERPHDGDCFYVG